MTDESNRLHIDSDWKAQAQAEKDRLAAKEAERSAEAEPGAGEMPPADFRGLIMTLGSQAMMGLGAYGDPNTGQVMIDLPGAQFAIDLLGVIEEKTKGNLTPEESAELKEVLAQLQARFVHVAKLVTAQMQARARAGAPDVAGSIGFGGSAAPHGSGPGSGSGMGSGMGTSSGLIMPD